MFFLNAKNEIFYASNFAHRSYSYSMSVTDSVHLLPYVLPLLGYNSISLHLENIKSEHLTTSVCTEISLFLS